MDLGVLVRFVKPTQDTPELTAAATTARRRIWREGYQGYRAGVLMDDLQPADTAPGAWVVEHDRERRAAPMDALDAINSRWGRRSIYVAGAGVDQGWRLRAALKSQHWTTRLDELPRAG